MAVGKYRFYSVCFIGVFVLSALTGCRGRNIDLASGPAPGLSDSVPIREGDIIFRQGIGIEATLVNKIDSASLFSHVGIFVDTLGGKYVVHILPRDNGDNEKGGIRLQSVADFLRPDRARAYAVIRIGGDGCGARKAADYAKSCLRADIPFDYTFNTEDSTMMYCSELVWRAYLQGGIDISEGRRHCIPAMAYPVIFPSDLFFCARRALLFQRFTGVPE